MASSTGGPYHLLVTGKLTRRAIRERAKLLLDASPALAVSGLKPGTCEYERRIKDIAATLSTDEVRELLGIKTEPSDA